MGREIRRVPVTIDPSADPETRELIASAEALRPNTAPVVESSADYEFCAARLRELRAMERQLEERRKEITRPLDEVKRAVMALFRRPAEALEQSRGMYGEAMRTWDLEQVRQRREAEARAAEAARLERERLEREAAVERARQEEAARRARAKAEAAAAKLEEKGRAEVAEARRRAAEETERLALEQAAEREEHARRQAEMMPAAPVIHQAPPKVEGVHRRRSWKFEVADPAAVPREYLAVDEVKIGKVVRALGPDANIPGVVVYEDASYVARSR